MSLLPSCLKHFSARWNVSVLEETAPYLLVQPKIWSNFFGGSSSLNPTAVPLLQTSFAVYLFIHGHIVPVDTLRCSSRRGVREGAGVGSGALHCPPIRGPPLRAGRIWSLGSAQEGLGTQLLEVKVSQVPRCTSFHPPQTTAVLQDHREQRE